jgi:hypothetical protein
LHRRIVSAVLSLVTIGMATATIVAPGAAAEPGVTTNFPVTTSATQFTGEGFDVCTAPTLSQMTAWSASPYRAIGVYVGGPNRGCAQPNLTSAWVTAVSAKGWKLMPIYVGLQAPCATRTTFDSITASEAEAEGKASATDAVADLTALGLRSGSIVYSDMESYHTDVVACRTAVLTYLSAFTKELHRRGFLSGVYGKAASTIGDLNGAYESTEYARPDAIWLAEWDQVKSLAGFAGVPATAWSLHQRAKQYYADHYETYGGVKLRIDSNLLDVPVATVLRSFRSTAEVTTRVQPTGTSKAGVVLAKNSALKVVCQTPGQAVSGTKVWDKLGTGVYISDHFVNTASSTTYSAGVPRCLYPYQVTPAAGSTVRKGAGAAFASTGTAPSGALGWTVCQTAATEATGTSKVWNQLQNGRYVPDFDLASASQTTYSPAVPLC